MKKVIRFTVNGNPYELGISPNITLAELLRNEIGLKGTKVGCDMGACGSCTVLLDNKAVKSCSILALQVEGRTVVTIEGLNKGDRLHPIQQSFVENHGFQCGFCTPGMVLSAHALLHENLNPEEHQVREAIEGHICRCGTYPNIVKSILHAAKLMRRE